jgi:hypothetical protein
MMRFYIDQRPDWQGKPYDTRKIAAHVKDMFGVDQVTVEESKNEWCKEEGLVCFDCIYNVQNYPEHASFHNWLWENGLTVGIHWREFTS